MNKKEIKTLIAKYNTTMQDISSIQEYKTDRSNFYFDIEDWFLFSTKSKELKSFDCFPTSEARYLQLVGTLVHPSDAKKNIPFFCVGQELESFVYDSSGSSTTGIWIQTAKEHWIKLDIYQIYYIRGWSFICFCIAQDNYLLSAEDNYLHLLRSKGIEKKDAIQEFDYISYKLAEVDKILGKKYCSSLLYKQLKNWKQNEPNHATIHPNSNEDEEEEDTSSTASSTASHSSKDESSKMSKKRTAKSKIIKPSKKVKTILSDSEDDSFSEASVVDEKSSSDSESDEEEEEEEHQSVQQGQLEEEDCPNTNTCSYCKVFQFPCLLLQCKEETSSKCNKLLCYSCCKKKKYHFDYLWEIGWTCYDCASKKDKDVKRYQLRQIPPPNYKTIYMAIISNSQVETTVSKSTEEDSVVLKTTTTPSLTNKTVTKRQTKLVEETTNQITEDEIREKTRVRIENALSRFVVENRTSLAKEIEQRVYSNYPLTTLQVEYRTRIQSIQSLLSKEELDICSKLKNGTITAEDLATKDLKTYISTMAKTTPVVLQNEQLISENYTCTCGCKTISYSYVTYGKGQHIHLQCTQCDRKWIE